ncbi:MAG: hypothetical protein MUE88_10250 [Flavobacteriales bacterium]|jgi:hypothetical protein|nr:hypothetical protein [Flavobacteriales bacterium]
MTTSARLVLCCGLAALLHPASAQDTTTPKTLLGNGAALSTDDLGFSIAPAYGITSMDGRSASLFQLRAGVGIKDKLTLGGYFNTSLNEIRPQSEVLPNIYMDYWSVGGYMEYTLLSDRVVHLTFPLMVGFGEVEMDNEPDNLELGEANFLVVEPAALMELNLTKYVRFNLGAGYRLVGDMAYRNFTQAEISGLTGYIGLRVGLFR